MDYCPKVGNYTCPTAGAFDSPCMGKSREGKYSKTRVYNNWCPMVGEFVYHRSGVQVGDANCPILRFNCVLFVQMCIHRGFTHCIRNNTCLSRSLCCRPTVEKFCCSSSILFT